VPSRSPPYQPPPKSPVPVTIPPPKLPGGTFWWQGGKKQPFKHIAAAADIGWKITNPVPTLKNLKIPNFGRRWRK
jgi:hypothetical protein